VDGGVNNRFLQFFLTEKTKHPFFIKLLKPERSVKLKIKNSSVWDEKNGVPIFREN
jgi:hypothetical protein